MQLEKTENESHWKLLNIFAFGTYSDYKGKTDSLQEKKKAENITTPLYHSQRLGVRVKRTNGFFHNLPAKKITTFSK